MGDELIAKHISQGVPANPEKQSPNGQGNQHALHVQQLPN